MACSPLQSQLTDAHDLRTLFRTGVISSSQLLLKSTIATRAEDTVRIWKPKGASDSEGVLYNDTCMSSYSAF